MLPISRKWLVPVALAAVPENRRRLTDAFFGARLARQPLNRGLGNLLIGARDPITRQLGRARVELGVAVGLFQQPLAL